MASLLKILGLSMWLYLASQGSTTVHVFSKTFALPVHGTLHIDGDSSIGNTDEDFICATMDWWPSTKCDYGTCSWGNASLLNIDLSNEILLNAIRAFSPLKLRLGGTLQDNIRYQTRDDPRPCREFVKKSSALFGFTQGCLPIARWDELNNFFMQSGAKIIFGLNAMTGRKIWSDGIARGAWDSTNSAEFIRDTVERGYLIHGWELGNELSGRGVGTRVLASQYASDVNNLQELVQGIYSDYDSEEQPLVLAPGGFFNEDWYTEFVGELAQPLQVVTHHIYNLGPGVDAHLIDKILNASYLDQEAKVFRNLQTLLKYMVTPPVAWVGEAGGAYNSGSDLVTNAFVFSFWYLDQLGMSASYDTKTYCRQSLIGGNYGLLDTNTFVPNPDYYSALLWHRLMGTNVLSTSFTGPKSLRAYAHCSKYSAGVTLLLINLDKSTSVQVGLSMKTQTGKTKSSSKRKQPTEYENVRDEYHLTAKGGNLQSRIMLLNGEVISLSSSGEIPSLEPKKVHASEPITVAPLSILFARIPSIQALACE